MSQYQLSFDDLDRANKIASMPGRSAYLDESGSFGFDFTKPDVTTHYVVCAIIIENKNIPNLEQRVEQLRKQYFSGHEMKSSNIGPQHSRRAKLLVDLIQLDFQVLLLIADKKAFIKDSPLTEYRQSFVKFLHQQLYDSMYAVYPKLKIIEDGYGDAEFQAGYRKYVEQHRPQENFFNEYDFEYVDSQESNITQIADIIAGAVMQHIKDPSAPDVLRIFRGKIVDIVNFPRSFQFYSPAQGAHTKYDNSVYELAVKCASDFISQNRNNEAFEVRMRIHFLRYLLFNAKMYNESRYIYADEIVAELNIISEKHINKDFLYRRIIAPLRDDGVIIASSSHGYKIPKTADDIATYISQTTTVVGPMLSRIGKCRTLIIKQTDGALDVLNDHSLQGYKRYFGEN